jgi:hypothetical protein
MLLGDQPALAPEAVLYQRLLVMDDQEARSVAEKYVGANSLLQFYDSVILRTLTLAEHDRHQGSIDPEHEEFLFLSLREMLAELSEKAQTSSPEDGETPREAIPGRVLCFPANDDADEIAAAMLAQLLEQAGCATISIPQGLSARSIFDVVEPGQNDIFCISAVPPFAFSHARNVNRILRAKFPQTRIVVAMWGFSGEIPRALQRFHPAPPDALVTNLTDVLEYLAPAKPIAKADVSQTRSSEAAADSSSAARNTASTGSGVAQSGIVRGGGPRASQTVGEIS